MIENLESHIVVVHGEHISWREAESRGLVKLVGDTFTASTPDIQILPPEQAVMTDYDMRVLQERIDALRESVSKFPDINRDGSNLNEIFAIAALIDDRAAGVTSFCHYFWKCRQQVWDFARDKKAALGKPKTEADIDLEELGL